MSFPSGADYMEALQHPADCFAHDPELANGVPVASPLGLPRAISGNFAAVFRVDCESGRSYAVRCFTRWFDDQIKKMGVKNCSFPLFVSEDVLKKEKDQLHGR